MARCKTGNCGKKRKELAAAARSGDVKKTVEVAVEGIRMMVGLDAGKIKLLPVTPASK